MKKKILLVEDNPMIRELVQDILEMEGYALSTVGSGSEALTLLKDESFDLILTDIHLPKMDGVEFLERSRNLCGLIVAITSDSKASDGRSFQEVGFDGFIQKPFKVAEFRAYIQTMLQ